MEIDFRQQCFGCGDNIKMLAGDGTKIGITLKQANVVPIEKKQEDIPPVSTASKGLDRVLINKKKYGENRTLVNSSLHKLALHKLDKETLSGEQLLQTVAELKGSNETLLITAQHLILMAKNKETASLAKLLAMLTEPKASLVNFLPWKYIDLVEKLANLVSSTGRVEVTTDLWKFRDEFYKASMYFFPELGEWVNAAIINSKGKSPEKYMILLLKTLVEDRKQLHSIIVQEEQPNNIKSYNPPRDGRAYYFTKEGNQLRAPRAFTIDKDDTKTEDEAVCKKSYPTVTKKGSTYLFLWFCPCHGHCYGFHIIPKAEGRKDAANSLYMFLKEAPTSVFYDFACSLEEYCRNRESGYFELTSFFHDIFHGYTHKCSKTFKSNRLQGFSGANTSICEQLNSFLQCVKTSAKLMTQEHFCFFLQFFIHQWNIERERSYKKKASIAMSGLE